MKKYSTLLFFFCLSVALSAQVHINEYSASNLHEFTDNFLRTEDWIELYNTSEVSVDVGGWYLSDKEDKPKKWKIPAGTIIGPNDFLVFWCSGRDMAVDGAYHTNFRLTQTRPNEYVSLAEPDGTVVDLFPLALTLVEHSRCRSVDGGDIWKVCTDPTPGSSNDSAPQFNGYTMPPSMTLGAGFYNDTLTIGITNNEPNSVLRYTTDGTNPTPNSAEYTEPLVVQSTTVIKAQAYSNDSTILTGKMDFNTYFINEDFSLAVFSVAADEVIDLANGDGSLIPIGSLEYFNLDKEREATSFGSLNRHGKDSWALPHRSIDWVSRDEMGYSKAVDAPLFAFSDRDEYQKFMFRNSGDDNYPAVNDNAHEGSAHIRDEYVQTLAMKGGMKLDTRAVERVILFLNGQYWGVYGMRDRPVDHDYTDEYYDQGKYDIQYLTTWGGTEIQYGGEQALQDWLNFRDFILENDMSDPTNYEIAEDSLNMTSLIDYMIVNLSAVASDWLNYNTGWWRGRDPDGDHKKWGYILWDLDATFDYYINYSGVPNTDPDAVPCDLEEISDFMDDFFGNNVEPDTATVDAANCVTILNGSSPYPATDTVFIQTIIQDPYCCETGWDNICQNLYNEIAAGNNDNNQPQGDIGRHEKIFLKLLDENETFKELYYQRYADMINTVYTCENMMNTLDSMVAVIKPEMPGQIERWGGSVAEWLDNVDELRGFIAQRCELLDDGMLDCYEELTGPYKVTLLTQPDGVGEIDFNTLDIENFPWSGDYFGGMENKIKAKVFNDYDDEYVFSHWVTTAGNFIPDSTDRKTTITLEQPDTLIAVFDAITSIHDVDPGFTFRVYPNPANDYLTLEYELDQAMDVRVSLYSVLGEQMAIFQQAGGDRAAGSYTELLSLHERNIPSGLYYLVVQAEDKRRSVKVTVMR